MRVNHLILKKWISPEVVTYAFAKEFGEEGLSWLDSDGSEQGRFSILGCKPKKFITCRNLSNRSSANNPFKRLREIKTGYWMGWLSYEAGSWIEPSNLWHESDMATLWIASYDPIIKFDLLNKKIIIEGTHLSELKKYKKIIENINLKEFKIKSYNNLEFNFSNINLEKTGKQFKENILRIKKLIAIGDIFQANLAVKCVLNSLKKHKYLDIYSKIRREIKSPFGGLIISSSSEFREAVLSTSPERFLKISHDGFIETRPIKGTRPRDKEQKKDFINAIELITNEKDRAENIMIVDLLRNDLGKVCETGSIFVTELLKLESYAKVHHLTSVIKAKIKKGKNWIDLLEACWPGGSITGAPKVRSCQRIYEMEKFDRGPYCGSFLQIDWNGNFDSNILIRSFILKDQTIKVHAGCGIVHDSNPDLEEEELKWKLLPLINSLK